MKRYIISIVMVSLFFMTNVSQAGVLSWLSKLSKSVDIPDINIPDVKLKVPSAYQGYDFKNIKQDVNGELIIIHSDLSRSSIKDTQNKKKMALIINEVELPSDIKKMIDIVAGVPLFIKSKNNQLFRINKGDGLSLQYDKVNASFKTKAELLQTLWYLQKPVYISLPKYISMGDALGEKQKIIDTVESVYKQTIVIAADFNQHKKLQARLKSIAESKDLQLVLLDAKNPKDTLLMYKSREKSELKNGLMKHQNNADYLNALVVKGSAIQVDVNKVGNNQVIIKTESPDEGSKKVSQDVKGELLPFHLAFHSVSVIQPDRERLEELDRRLFDNIDSWVQYYVFVSVLAGITAISTSWRLWKKVWSPVVGSGLKRKLAYVGARLLHIVLFVMLFLPLFGVFSFIWAVFYYAYKIMRFIIMYTVIKPVAFFINLLARRSGIQHSK